MAVTENTHYFSSFIIIDITSDQAYPLTMLQKDAEDITNIDLHHL